MQVSPGDGVAPEGLGGAMMRLGLLLLVPGALAAAPGAGTWRLDQAASDAPGALAMHAPMRTVLEQAHRVVTPSFSLRDEGSRLVVEPRGLLRGTRTVELDGAPHQVDGWVFDATRTARRRADGGVEVTVEGVWGSLELISSPLDGEVIGLDVTLSRGGQTRSAHKVFRRWM
jgi:hypothetical protein